MIAKFKSSLKIFLLIVSMMMCSNVYALSISYEYSGGDVYGTTIAFLRTTDSVEEVDYKTFDTDGPPAGFGLLSTSGPAIARLDVYADIFNSGNFAAVSLVGAVSDTSDSDYEAIVDGGALVFYQFTVNAESDFTTNIGFDFVANSTSRTNQVVIYKPGDPSIRLDLFDSTSGTFSVETNQSYTIVFNNYFNIEGNNGASIGYSTTLYSQRVVPEPPTAALLFIGLAGMISRFVRCKRSSGNS